MDAMERPETDSAPRLVAPRDLRAMVGGLSESSIRRLVDAGEFPAPIVLARTKAGHPCRIAWIEAEVSAWVVRRIEAARPSTPSEAA